MQRRGASWLLVILLAGLLAYPSTANDHDEVPVGPADTRRHSPSVAVDSSDPKKMVIATYDAHRFAIRLFISRDGGRSFVEAAAPKSRGWRQFQPEVLLVGGTFYITYAAYDDDEAAIVVVRSDDLGASWDRPRYAFRTIMETETTCRYPSSPSLAIEPSRPSVVFAAWESWDYLNGCEEEIVATWVARSDDGGTRFGGAVEVPLPRRGDSDWVYYPQLVARPDGGVVLIAEVDRMSSDRSCPSAHPQDVVVSVSDDAGRRFRSQILAETCSPARVFQFTPIGFVALNSTGSTHYHGTRVTLAVNRKGGLTAAWIAGNAAGISRLSTAYSPDGGHTWQAAGVPSEPEINQQHFPALAAAPDGSFVALYVAQMPGGVIEPRMSVGSSDGAWSSPVRLATRPGVTHESPLWGTTYVALWTSFGEATAVAVGGDGIAHPAWVDLRERRIGPAAPPYQVLTRRVGVAK